MLGRGPFPMVDVPDHHHHTLGSVIFAVGNTGMVGNFLIMYTFCRSKSLRTPANMFIINLALTDFLMCVTQTPIFFINSMHNRWIFGEKGWQSVSTSHVWVCCCVFLPEIVIAASCAPPVVHPSPVHLTLARLASAASPPCTTVNQ
nr:melanopsin-A-like [Oncorhynchus nerka]